MCFPLRKCSKNLTVDCGVGLENDESDLIQKDEIQLLRLKIVSFRILVQTI